MRDPDTQWNAWKNIDEHAGEQQDHAVTVSGEAAVAATVEPLPPTMEDLERDWEMYMARQAVD